ncbi:hypothetical protein BT69DRAFT_1332746 [Atractiella rhizophila]|nr:hypothetical protein BT69DRAFT_1332746 [Atractiella rhizophila]
MSESFNTFKIEPLKTNNWVVYKRRITAVLQEGDLLDYVIGKKKGPHRVDPFGGSKDGRYVETDVAVKEA